MEIKDSGTRNEFATGAVRDAETGKGRFDLLPCHALTRLAQHFENGARKYADRNWEKGIPTHRYLDSALRHTFKYLDGYRDEDHLAAAAWNLLCLIETEHRIDDGRLPKELQTLPQPSDPKALDHMFEKLLAMAPKSSINPLEYPIVEPRPAPVTSFTASCSGPSFHGTD
jgi:hypothetical protein